MADKIRLVRTGDGTYDELDEQGNREGVAWVRDEYTEPRDTLYECAACGLDIEDWWLWTCLDGGDTAHRSCVEVTDGGPQV